MTKRVRVFFVNCPTLAIDAASFLILSQNFLQTSLQFEVHHLWIYGLSSIKGRRWVSKSYMDMIERHKAFGFLLRKYRAGLDLRVAPAFKKCLSRDSCLIVAQELVNSYHSWLRNSGYNVCDCSEAPSIIVTEAPLQDGYISYCGRSVGVISVANWRRLYSPVSALEYVLTSTQRLSLRLCYGQQIGSHYPTRGCLWDFDVNQADFKISALLGFLCDTCRERLKAATSDGEYEDIRRLIDNKWIGDASDLSSVAGLLAKNYRYDLSRSIGLNPGIWARLVRVMQSGLGRYIFEILKWVTIFVLTVTAVKHFPWIAKLLVK